MDKGRAIGTMKEHQHTKISNQGLEKHRVKTHSARRAVVAGPV